MKRARLTALIVLAGIALAGAPAGAAEVELVLEADVAYEGEPLLFQVRITDPDGSVRESTHTLNATGDTVWLGTSPAGPAYVPEDGWCREPEPPGEEEL